ncbi:putative uncharacterized protein [Pseudomonas sp. St29]|nr:putative uncharacterized protein [Pseudomonas sp. St29]
MTSWCDGVYSDFVQLYIAGVLEKHKEQTSCYEIKKAVPAATQNNGTWYDDFVRLPDYLAGVIAKWDIDSNIIDSEKQKSFFINNIVDAKNIATIRITFDRELLIEKIIAKRR